MTISRHNPQDYGRILALDWGTVRIGAALSDPGRSLSSPYDTFSAKPVSALLDRLSDTVRQFEITAIIIGLPVNMDGSEGPSARKAREFANLVAESTGISVECVDERLSSHEAEKTLRAAGRKPSRDKGRVDRVAAALLLQEYLDSLYVPGGE